MNIKRKYHRDQQLAKVSLGAREPLLSHVDDSLKNCFSNDFLFIPIKKDVMAFHNSLKNEKTITWQINSSKIEKISQFDNEVNKFLNNEKNKLIKKIEELHASVSAKSVHSEKKELLDKLKSFSFDWDNPEGKVYKLDDGYAILDWGLCDRNGGLISLPFNSKPITAEPNTTEPIITEPIITEPITTEPVTREPIKAEPDVENKNKSWGKNWLIGAGILFLIFLIKNCNPTANLKIVEFQDRYRFYGNLSHDSSSFFQKGIIFEETEADSLKLNWQIFKINSDNIYELYYKELEKPSIVLNKELGKFIITLKVEDGGNKLGFLKKKDSASYFIEINQIFNDLNNLDTIFIIKYKTDMTGAPIDSSIKTLSLETIRPYPSPDKGKEMTEGGVEKAGGDCFPTVGGEEKAGGSEEKAGSGGEKTGGGGEKTGGGGEKTGGGKEPTGSGKEPTGGGEEKAGGGEEPTGGGEEKAGGGEEKAGGGEKEKIKPPEVPVTIILKTEHRRPVVKKGYEGWTGVMIEERKCSDCALEIIEEYYLNPLGNRYSELKKSTSL